MKIAGIWWWVAFTRSVHLGVDKFPVYVWVRVRQETCLCPTLQPRLRYPVASEVDVDVINGLEFSDVKRVLLVIEFV